MMTHYAAVLRFIVSRGEAVEDIWYSLDAHVKILGPERCSRPEETVLSASSPLLKETGRRCSQAMALKLPPDSLQAQTSLPAPASNLC